MIASMWPKAGFGIRYAGEADTHAIDATTEDEARSTAGAHAARRQQPVHVMETWTGEAYITIDTIYPMGER